MNKPIAACTVPGAGADSGRDPGRGRKILVPAAWAILAAALAGCAQAPGPRPAPAAKLPEKALVKLADLKPPIAKPVNPPSAGELSPQVKQIVLEAEKAMASGNFNAAIGPLERAAAFEPENPRILRGLGLAYAPSNPGKSQENLSRALGRVPDDLEGQVLLGRLFSAQRQNDRAVLAYRTAMECSGAKPENPLTAEALQRLSRLLAEEGYWTAALEGYARLAEWIDLYGRNYANRMALRDMVLRPDVLLAQRGWLLLELQRPAEAAQVLDNAYRRNRSNMQASKLLVEAFIQTRNFTRAEALLVDLAEEPGQAAVVGELAQRLCEASKDKQMPGRIWRALDKRRQFPGELAAALAQSARRLGADDEAVSILKSVLAAMPGNVPAGRALAGLYARQGNGQQALRLLGEILAVDPSATATVDEGIGEIVAAAPPEGLEQKFVEAITPDSAGRFAMHYVAGRLADARSKHALAAAEYRKAVEARKDFLPAYDALLDLYLLRNNEDQAVQLVQAIGKLPEDKYGYFAFYAQGKLKLSRGQTDAAVKDLEQARVRNSQDVPTLLLLSQAYNRLRRFNDAEAVLKAALNADGDNVEVYRRLFDLMVATGQQRKSLEVARELLRLQPASVAGRAMLAEYEWLWGSRPAATGIIAELQKQAPDDLDVLYLVVRARLEPKAAMTKAQFDDTVRRLGAIIRRDGRNEKAKFLLAQLLSQPNWKAEAPAILAKLYQDTDKQPDVGRAYISALIAADQLDEAQKAMEEFLANNPRDPFVRQMTLAVLEKLKKYDQACQLGETWIKEADENQAADLRVRLLRLYELSERFDKAQKLLDDWLASATDEKMIAALRAWKLRDYAKAGQYDQAVAAGRKWIRESPQDLNRRKDLLAALWDQEQYDRALRLVDEWLKEKLPTTLPSKDGTYDPVVLWCWKVAPRLLLAQQKTAEALQRVQESLKLLPADTELLSLKAVCLSEQGKVAESTAVLEKALEAKPDDPDLCNDLGYSYADQGVLLDKAERLIRQALADRPGQTAVMDSLAWVFYKQGKFAEARNTFEQVLEAPQDQEQEIHPIILDHAGDTYCRLGDKAKALELWKKAIEAAKKEKSKTQDVARVLENTPGKIKALESGAAPKTAPLGQGVREPEKGAKENKPEEGTSRPAA